jgi:CHAT domain-containing protein
MIGIIPHDVLHYLPFTALTDGKRYLGDDYTLFTLPSASVLPFIQQNRKPEGVQLLAMAHGQAEGLPILHYADQEVRAIAKLYNSQPLITPSATLTTFLARASDYSILHIAAHGQLNNNNPLFSKIILAPGANDDGSLDVHQIYSLNLAKANLVVLSACESQLGARSKGDDIVGLNRAFIYAGAPTVITSLWSVDDSATSELMISFYKHLQSGKAKAEALREAQADIKDKYPHPYYWAAFILTGDPGVASSTHLVRDQ